MLDQETIDDQFALLTTYRRTLAHLLQQAAQYGGEVHVPVSIANGIYEVRNNIQSLKATLRVQGLSIEDFPYEDLPLSATPLRISETDRRNRSRLLQKVRNSWIEGILNHSLHGAALLALGLEA